MTHYKHTHMQCYLTSPPDTPEQSSTQVSHLTSKPDTTGVPNTPVSRNSALTMSSTDRTYNMSSHSCWLEHTWEPLSYTCKLPAPLMWLVMLLLHLSTVKSVFCTDARPGQWWSHQHHPATLSKGQNYFQLVNFTELVVLDCSAVHGSSA